MKILFVCYQRNTGVDSLFQFVTNMFKMSQLPLEKKGKRKKEKKTLFWASGFRAYCEDMIIIVCLPSHPRSPYYSRELSKPPGTSWKWSDFEGSKNEAESNALVCEKGTVIETSTSYMLTLSSINTFSFSSFTQLQWTSNDRETAHTLE